jgi:hypothetical protein
MNIIKTICAALLLITGFLEPQLASAQAPEKMSYQAVIRNSSGTLMNNQTIGMQISILQGSVNGTAIYIETQSPTTNENGLASIEIGAGTIVTGTFSDINWSAGPYFIKTETDPTGGTNYSIIGTSQLLSVPYALHAKTAESIIEGNMNETDPIFGSSIASGISALDTATWNNKQDQLTAGTGINITGNTISATSGGGGFTHYIGEQFGGGVIYHLWKDAQGLEHGLIVDLTDLSTTQVWSNVGAEIGNSAKSIWDGLTNSNAIVNQNGHASSAAALCFNSNNGGQSDWYLPSIQELNMLWCNYFDVARTLTQIPNATLLVPSFTSTIAYWSSTETNMLSAWLFRANTGDLHPNTVKSTPYYVRAIRAF